MTSSNVIHLAGVSKRYGQIEVLQPIDLAIVDGEFLTILGPSGSGKTTILRMIGGFTRPSAGRILFEGVDIVDRPIFARPFNTVFQDYALFPHMTVAKNVGYGLAVKGQLTRAQIRAKVIQALAVVDLADKAESHPADLSGGQRQRVALARAIICEPRVVLLDEPLAALDAELRRSMQGFLKGLQRQIRTTFVFITHDQEEAIAMADRIVVMDHGKVEQVGTPQDIYYRPISTFVAKFFGDSNLLPGEIVDSVGNALVVRSPLGTMSLPKPPGYGIAAGAAVNLATRSESFRVVDESGLRPSESGMQGRVAGVTFLGAATQLIVELDHSSGKSVKVRAPTRDIDGRLGEGDRLILAVLPSEISVLAG